LHDSFTSPRGEEWGEFLHLPDKRFYDFNEIRKEIERETDRVTGKNKGISNQTINLKIYSPYVLNLTLVDLPGITKVPTGDQPEDVEEQIRAMCYEFISNPNAIILAVTAANQDLVNSDGLKMARSVDPDGERTIGVLTKVDIMDQGTDCADILANRVVPLRRGYVAVVNRSQKDINDDLPIRQGLLKEQKFFQSHPKYRSMLSKCGTTNLARTLNQILMLHIRDCLPDIKSRIMSMMTNVQSNIDALGESADDQGPDKLGGTMLNLLSKFAQSVSSTIDGRGTHELAVEMTELYGGARLSYIFNEVFGRTMKGLDPFDGLDDDDIRTAIANANGPRPSLFVPEISFDLLVRKQIARLEQPGLQCVDLAFDEMQRMAYQCESPEINRFPELRERLFEIVSQLLKNCVGPTQKMISNLIQVELAYINTSHPDFIGGKAAVAQLNRKLNTNEGGASGTVVVKSAGEIVGQGTSNSVPFQSGHPSTPGRDQNSPPPPANTSQHSSGAGAAGGQGPMTAGAAANAASGGGFLGLFRGSGAAHGAGSAMAGRPASGSAGVLRDGHVENSRTAGAKSSSDLVKLPQVPDKMRSSSTPTDRERVETEIIKSLISSYFDIVKKNFMDLVPKTIMHFLVNSFKEGLQNELVCKLYREATISELMRENDDVATRRRACKEMKELLLRALEILNEIRDFNTFK
jgi:dynamin 1-like protein